MPLLDKKEFIPEECPANLKPEDNVFFLPTTGEVFTSYEAFFQRQITLNSLVWTCSATGKSGLTYEEALESEKNAQEALETFPDHFGIPVLYLVHKLSFRGRLEDLVNDVYMFIKDRYFVGEECAYRRKRTARILNVAYTGEDFTKSVSKGQHDSINDQITSNAAKRSEMHVGPAGSYSYTVQLITSKGIEDDSGVRENVSYKDLSRTKAISSRARLKLFLKNSCMANGERQIVKESLVEEFHLDSMSWTDIFGGPVAQFPRTPSMHRGPPKGTPRPPRLNISDGAISVATVQHVEDGKKTLQTIASEKKPRGRPKGSVGAEKRAAVASESSKIDGAQKPKPKASPSKAEKAKMEKLRREIEKQQEELQMTFNQARKTGLENLAKWEQRDRVLSAEEIAELKIAIRTAREQERERIREAKQRERELQAEWRKPRDDVLCDNLKPLPKLETLRLPEWMSDEDFGSCLYILEFFQTFGDILPLKEIRGTSKVTFAEVVNAVRSNDPRSGTFVELLHVLLLAKAERADEEDGDEANLNNKEELSADPNNDLDNKVYGKLVRQATTLHETIRLTYGASARHLPIDWMTVTEVLRLMLLSSGYYTGISTHRFRLFNRGGPRCYEDEGFIFANNNTRAMKILEEQSIFELEPSDRIALFKVLIQQLNSYNKFRSISEERINTLQELRRELRNLRILDAAQEKEAKEARLLREYEAEQIEENGEAARADFPARPKPSKDTSSLIFHLKLTREGIASRRDDKLNEIQRIMQNGIAYAEMDIEDIDDAREMQKEYFSSKEGELLNKIFKLQAAMGSKVLGRDRAYRSYLYVDSLPMLLVENPAAADEIGPCYDEPTPLDKVTEDVRGLFSNDDELRVGLLGCTSNSECPVHSNHSRPHWEYISSTETLESVVAACNSRGFREADLGENLKFLKPCLLEFLQRSNKKINSGELWKELLLDATDPAAVFSDFDWIREFVEMLLDFEEKIEQGGIGHLHTGSATVNREEWRQSLQDNKYVSSFVEGDMEFFDETTIAEDVLKNMDRSPVKQLALAFLQIVQGVNIKFLRLPFAAPSSKEKDAPNIPTTIFVQWQKALLECRSIPALSLFYATLEPGVLWSKSRLQAKCRICRRRGVAENLVLCVQCDRCYHTDCVKPKLPKVCENWKCSDCVTMQKAKEAEERRKTRKNNALVEDDNDEGISDEDEAGSSSLFDDEMNSADDGYETPPDMQKTTSGRMVKKVVYTEEPVINGNRKGGRRSGRGRADNADSEADSDVSIQPRPKRARGNNGEVPLRSVSMGLRETDHQSRDALRALEPLLRDAMKQENAWPFVQPVDSREVPDYYHIIKRPMDLRTMMNKLKQQLYDRPEQLVADTRLMFDNCRIYNDEASEICRCADKLEEFMEQRFEQLLRNGHSNGFGSTRSSRR